MEFITGMIVGIFFGLGALVLTGHTPLDIEQKLCAEAKWELPSCKQILDKAVADAKGTKP